MLASRNTNKTKILFWAVVALAVLVRLAHLAESADDPSAYQPLVDSRTYHELATGLSEDSVLDEHFLWQAPLYPLFLAAVYKLLGVSLLAVKLLQIFLAGATCFLTMRLGRKLFDENTSLIAGVMVALCGPLLFFDQQLLATPLAVFWMIALANISFSLHQNQGPRFSAPALTLGVVGALAILTRSTFLPMVLVLLVWPFHGRFSAQRLSLGIAGLLIVLVPFALTMQNQTGHMGVLPPSGAINLYIGNNSNFDETIGIRTGLPWEKLIGEPMQHGYEPGPWNGQEYFRSRVKDFISGNPGEFLSLLGKKTVHLFSSRELPRNLDMYVHRQWSAVLSSLLFKLGPWGFPMGLLLPLAAVGLMVGRSKNPSFQWWMLLAYAASLILVFTASRYRAPLLPLLCIQGAYALVWLRLTYQQRDWRTLFPAAALFAGVMLVTAIPGPFAQEKSNFQSELHYGAGWNFYQQEQWVEAEKEFRKAVSANEGYPEAHNFLALVLVRQELWDEAMEHFFMAVQLNPNYSEAVNNLELCRSKRAEAHYRHGRSLEGINPAETIQIYKGIMDFFPDWPEVSVRLAWMLSTGDDAEQRDGPRAIELLSQPALAKVSKDPYVMFVYSAALAEVGQFEEAARTVDEARSKLSQETQDSLNRKMVRALALYKSGIQIRNADGLF